MSRSAANRPRDAISTTRNPFDSLSLAELRLRRSQKWRDVEPDVLPVWVFEMDFPLAEPVRDMLLEMVARGDTGYPTRTRLPETYAEFAADRYELGVDPSRISIVLDVMHSAPTV